MTEIRDSIAECRTYQDLLERPDYTEAEIQALRAVWTGTATSRQQKMSQEWAMRAFGKDDISYRPGDPEATAYAEGRRSAALLMVWMLKVAPTRTDNDRIAARHIGSDKEQGHG